jgi:hypothetical protein
MTRKLVLMALVALAALVLGGCGKTACERMCDYFDRCEGGIDAVDCEDECYDDYRDEDSGCQRALRDFAKCLDERSCENIAAGGCNSEALEADSEC